jgi:hypothetical protein
VCLCWIDRGRDIGRIRVLLNSGTDIRRSLVVPLSRY